MKLKDQSIKFKLIMVINAKTETVFNSIPCSGSIILFLSPSLCSSKET